MWFWTSKHDTQSSSAHWLGKSRWKSGVFSAAWRVGCVLQVCVGLHSERWRLMPSKLMSTSFQNSGFLDYFFPHLASVIKSSEKSKYFCIASWSVSPFLALGMSVSYALLFFHGLFENSFLPLFSTSSPLHLPHLPLLFLPSPSLKRTAKPRHAACEEKLKY